MKVEAHYIKTNDFKTIQISGAYGGLLGNGQINLNLFIDRIPIPKKATLEIQNDGSIKESISESINGIVREVPIGLVMDIVTTRALHELLGKMLEDQSKVKPQEIN